MTKIEINKSGIFTTYYEDGKFKLVAKLENDNVELTFKAFKEIPGHDDSFPFVASVYANGKKIGRATNDGWGAECSFYAEPKAQEIVSKLRSMVQGYSWSYRGEKHPYTSFESILDDMACQLADVGSLNKTLKSINRKWCLVGINKNMGSFSYLNMPTFSTFKLLNDDSKMAWRNHFENKKKEFQDKGCILINEELFSYLKE